MRHERWARVDLNGSNAVQLIQQNIECLLVSANQEIDDGRIVRFHRVRPVIVASCKTLLDGFTLSMPAAEHFGSASQFDVRCNFYRFRYIDKRFAGSALCLLSDAGSASKHLANCQKRRPLNTCVQSMDLASELFGESRNKSDEEAMSMLTREKRRFSQDCQHWC